METLNSNDKHRDQRAQLKQMQLTRRLREKEQARKHGGRSDTRLISDEASAKRDAAESAELAAKQRREYKNLVAGHAKEPAEMEKTRPP
jgi:hypothetical protein